MLLVKLCVQMNAAQIEDDSEDVISLTCLCGHTVYNIQNIQNIKFYIVHKY